MSTNLVLILHIIQSTKCTLLTYWKEKIIESYILLCCPLFYVSRSISLKISDNNIVY